MRSGVILFFFFFNDTATTEIYTLSLHDALPICPAVQRKPRPGLAGGWREALRRRQGARARAAPGDRKSTRLNSSHLVISYAVFCLKKKTKEPSATACIYTHLLLAYQPRSACHMS